MSTAAAFAIFAPGLAICALLTLLLLVVLDVPYARARAFLLHPISRTRRRASADDAGRRPPAAHQHP